MEPEYSVGPRIINGINIDADIISAQPIVHRRQVTDSVNDGSLGDPAYVSSSTNKDGTLF